MRRFTRPRSPSTRRPISASMRPLLQFPSGFSLSGPGAERVTSPSRRCATGPSLSPLKGGEGFSDIGRHQLRPAPVKSAMVRLTVPVVAGYGSALRVEFFAPEAHLVTQRIAPRDNAAPGLRAALPIVHVVLLERSARAKYAGASEPYGLFHLRRRRLVGVNKCPALGLLGAARMPHADRPRGWPQHREIGEHRSRHRLAEARSRSEALRQIRLDPCLVGQHIGVRHVGDRIGAGHHRAVPVARRHRAAGLVRLDAEISSRPGLHRRKMAPVHVVTVTGEVLGRKLPVARHDPFMNAADQLDAAVAAVEEQIEIPGHLAEILAQRRRLRIEGREIQPLVVIELRHWAEAPALAVQLAVIGFVEIRHSDQPPVIAVGPAVIGAGEGRGIAGAGAAQPVAAMAAHVEECAHLAARVAHHENRVLAHISRKEVAGLRDLALMAQEQPAARENSLELLLIDFRLDEDASADQAAVSINQLVQLRNHRYFPNFFRKCAAQLRRGTRSVAPASTVRIVPVMPLAFSLEDRKTYAPARSPGASAICSGLPARNRSSVLGSEKCERSSCLRTDRPRRSVTVPPGATPFTLTLGPNSAASCRIKPTTACFEAV